jgi:hypothetical protein
LLLSKAQGRYVFTDFGRTICIKEFVGQPTLTSIEGAPNYMSEHMKRILMGERGMGERGMVNLYLNDFHALNETIKDIPLITIKP